MTLRIDIPEPRFDPRRELIFNGYLYRPTLDLPAAELAEALQVEPVDQAEPDHRLGDFLAGIAFTLIVLAFGWGISGWIGVLT